MKIGRRSETKITVVRDLGDMADLHNRFVDTVGDAIDDLIAANRHLNRKIFELSVFGIALIWGAASLHERVKHLEDILDSVKETTDKEAK